MILKLGELGCPPNCLCKKFSSSYVYLDTVAIKEGTYLFNPTFVVTPDTSNQDLYYLFLYNYVICNYYNNDPTNLTVTYFYFIDEMFIDTNRLLNIKCHLDVLTQNASTIITALKNGNMILSRCGTKKRSETDPIVDAQVQFAGRKYDNYTMTSFPNTPFTWTKPYFVLTVAGDGSVSSSSSSAKENTLTEEESDENSTSTS